MRQNVDDSIWSPYLISTPSSYVNVRKRATYRNSAARLSKAVAFAGRLKRRPTHDQHEIEIVKAKGSVIREIDEALELNRFPSRQAGSAGQDVSAGREPV